MATRGTYYNARTMTIEVDDGDGHYPVNCERLVSSAEVLDFILQIADKRWCQAETIREFLRWIRSGVRRPVRAVAASRVLWVGDRPRSRLEEAHNNGKEALTVSASVMAEYAEEARAIIDALIDAGWTFRQIERGAQISWPTLDRIIDGHPCSRKSLLGLRAAQRRWNSG